MIGVEGEVAGKLGLTVDGLTANIKAGAFAGVKVDLGGTIAVTIQGKEAVKAAATIGLSFGVGGSVEVDVVIGASRIKFKLAGDFALGVGANFRRRQSTSDLEAIARSDPGDALGAGPRRRRTAAAGLRLPAAGETSGTRPPSLSSLGAGGGHPADRDRAGRPEHRRHKGEELGARGHAGPRWRPNWPRRKTARAGVTGKESLLEGRG